MGNLVSKLGVPLALALTALFYLWHKHQAAESLVNELQQRLLLYEQQLSEQIEVAKRQPAETLPFDRKVELEEDPDHRHEVQKCLREATRVRERQQQQRAGGGSGGPVHIQQNEAIEGKYRDNPPARSRAKAKAPDDDFEYLFGAPTLGSASGKK